MSAVSERDQRICEAAICILDGAASKRLNIVVLNKALFYADLVALRDHGDTLTGATYLALPNGPTIKSYDRHLVRPLTGLGWAVQEVMGPAKPMRKIATPDEFAFLTRGQQDLAREMGRKFEGITSAGASDLSHMNPGWVAAYDRAMQDNGRGKPINLVLALQQLDSEPDPWLDQDLTASERSVIESDSPALPWE